MNKRKWEIWTYDFPEKGPHPVVVISHPDRCVGGKVLNVLFSAYWRRIDPNVPGVHESSDPFHSFTEGSSGRPYRESESS